MLSRELTSKSLLSSFVWGIKGNNSSSEREVVGTIIADTKVRWLLTIEATGSSIETIPSSFRSNEEISV